MDTHLFGPGDRVGDYRVVRQIGTGGMSEVYSVEDEDGIVSTLKICVPHELLKARGAAKTAYDISKVQGSEERAVNEAKTLNQINHPHIMQVRRIIRGLPYKTTGLLLDRVDDARTLEEVMADIPGEFHSFGSWSVEALEAKGGFDEGGSLARFIDKYARWLDVDYYDRLNPRWRSLHPMTPNEWYLLHTRNARRVMPDPLQTEPRAFDAEHALRAFIGPFAAKGLGSLSDSVVGPAQPTEAPKKLLAWLDSCPSGQEGAGRQVRGRSPTYDVLNRALLGLQGRFFSVADQIRESVLHLGERGILHRDIYASNILVDNTFRAKLIDFGAASAVGEVNRWASRKAKPPEAYLGIEGATSDLWGLGILTYEMITGKHPFSRDKTSAAIEEETILAAELLKDPRGHCGGTLAVSFDQFGNADCLAVNKCMGELPMRAIYEACLPPEHKKSIVAAVNDEGEKSFHFLHPIAYQNALALLQLLAIHPGDRLQADRYYVELGGGLSSRYHTIFTPLEHCGRKYTQLGQMAPDWDY